ncbi:MAG: T9SS type A sorting domain-containing protein [Bacteroidota bacterium]
MKYFKICLLVFGLLLSTKIFAQVNPSLNYYPLHIGDEWQYKITHYEEAKFKGVSYFVKKVLSDTIMSNGKKYYRVEQPPFQKDSIKKAEIIFARLDSSSGLLYNYSVRDQKEVKVDSVFCRKGDAYFKWGTVQYELLCYDESEEMVLGENRATKSVMNWIISDEGFRWKLALGLGTVYQEKHLNWVGVTNNIYELVYAKINGVEYGQLVDVKKEKNNIPQEFSLSQNFPNPFNPSTAIKFSVPSVGAEHVQPLHVSLKVYDLLGREITTLVNEEKAPGNYEVRFNAETRRGESLPSGVYIYRLQAGSYSKTKKMILLK